MKIERIFKENSEINLDDIVNSIIEQNSKKSIDKFFEGLNIKEIDCIRKGDFIVC